MPRHRLLAGGARKVHGLAGGVRTGGVAPVRGDQRGRLVLRFEEQRDPPVHQRAAIVVEYLAERAPRHLVGKGIGPKPDRTQDVRLDTSADQLGRGGLVGIARRRHHRGVERGDEDARVREEPRRGRPERAGAVANELEHAGGEIFELAARRRVRVEQLAQEERLAPGQGVHRYGRPCDVATPALGEEPGDRREVEALERYAFEETVLLEVRREVRKS